MGPNVWYGDASSCCDLLRQLTKLHVTPSTPPNITALDKMREKARAFALTDSTTPIIGKLCTRIIRVCGEAEMRLDMRAMAEWGSDELLNQYLNTDSGWMEQYAADPLQHVYSIETSSTHTSQGYRSRLILVELQVY